MGMVKEVLGNDPETLASTLAAPVQLRRKAVFPVANFGSSMAPFYTLLPLWVGALLMVVTLKPPCLAGRAKHWAIRGRIGSSLGITGCSR